MIDPTRHQAQLRALDPDAPRKRPPARLCSGCRRKTRDASGTCPRCQAAEAALAEARDELSGAESSVDIQRERAKAAESRVKELIDADHDRNVRLDRAEAALENALQLADGLTHRVDAAEAALAAVRCCDAPAPVTGCDCQRCMMANTTAAVLRRNAAESQRDRAVEVLRNLLTLATKDDAGGYCSICCVCHPPGADRCWGAKARALLGEVGRG